MEILRDLIHTTNQIKTLDECFCKHTMKMAKKSGFDVDATINECNHINSLHCAVCNDYLGYTKYFYKDQPYLNVYICADAAKGHLECLRFLFENNCPWDIKTFQNAAEGHLDCLKYIFEQSLIACASEGEQSLSEGEQSLSEGEQSLSEGEQSLIACASAARGHLDCLKYLHSKGCSWNEKAFCHAARGHLECLKFLYEQSSTEGKQSSTEGKQSSTEGKNGCPWNEKVYEFAVFGHLDCLKFLHENGCPRNTTQSLMYAKDYPECLEYIRSTM
ncbi:MAG: ankyrin repeat domain-containing protein [Candidatus Aenigmarchaeota archaeon]|nr:ankyrin repeat domain-containing protein [Candidatus Aenigmarchaeota archaeon]